MARTASNIPLQGRSIENGTTKSLTSNYISTSDDGKKHTIRNVPYVIIIDDPDGKIIKSYYDYIYTYLQNVVSTDYRNIPYMRHLEESLDTHLFDINIDIDKIKQLLRKKFINSSLEFLDADVSVDRENKLISIICRLEYKGIIVNSTLLRKVADNEKTVVGEIGF